MGAKLCCDEENAEELRIRSALRRRDTPYPDPKKDALEWDNAPMGLSGALVSDPQLENYSVSVSGAWVEFERERGKLCGHMHGRKSSCGFARASPPLVY